jgi:hypothetical protein
VSQKAGRLVSLSELLKATELGFLTERTLEILWVAQLAG